MLEQISGEGDREAPLEDQVRDVAVAALDHINQTAERAEAELAERRPDVAMAFAANNSFTSSAGESLNDILSQSDQDLQALAREPAIARIVVEDDEGASKTIFITRAAPLPRRPDDAYSASYLSPMGRLAALPVGRDADVSTPDGLRSFEITERAVLKPVRDADGWDAVDTVFENRCAGPVTVFSLRDALRSLGVDVDDDDLLAQLIASDPSSSNIVDGLRRSVIDKIALRERSVLDEYQDDIFRLPLDTRLAILGPPGTGKTTTLIKRLRQKLDISFLEDAEKTQVAQSRAGVADHGRSWLMFTPTDLLKRYVVEALGREGVPASDRTVTTWDDHRMELARNRLGILRSATSPGGQYRARGDNLLPTTLTAQADWFEDFEAWQAADFWAGMDRAAATLAGSSDARVKRIGARLVALIPIDRTQATASSLLAFGDVQADVSGLEAELKAATEQKLRRSIMPHVKQDSSFLDRLHAFARTTRDTMDSVDDLDDVDPEEEEEDVPPRGNREEAIAIYINAQRRLARSAVQRRTISSKSRDGRILEWLGNRVLSVELQREVGEAEVERQALRQFASPVRQYVRRMRTRYGRFRRQRLSEALWYNESPLQAAELSPLEVDVVLLGMLRAGRIMLTDRRVLSALEEPRFAILRGLGDLLRNQIVVDEATDFSPIQLACMGQLSDPVVGSFVACGDFNQRVTAWGSRSASDLKWVFPDFDIRPIVTTYRHSRPLAELAARLSGEGTAQTKAQLPANQSNDGPRPVFAAGLDTEGLASWLSNRIAEIERMTGHFPSIAVLVNGEAEVEPVATALDEALVDLNIRCEACKDGQSRGKDNNVRVFDVQHIKGLEFEAVFFVGVDQLARNKPDLFDKFLYVGATRAATYLGLTTEQDATPEVLRPLLTDFAETFEEKPGVD